MRVRRTSSTTQLPDDPVGTAVADFIVELLGQAAVELHYAPVGGPPTNSADGSDRTRFATASHEVLEGWHTTLAVGLEGRVAGLVEPGGASPPEFLAALPAASLWPQRSSATSPRHRRGCSARLSVGPCETPWSSSSSTSIKVACRRRASRPGFWPTPSNTSSSWVEPGSSHRASPTAW